MAITGNDDGDSDLALGLNFAGDLIPALINGYQARRADSGGIAPAYRTPAPPQQMSTAVSAPMGKTVLILGVVFVGGVVLWIGASMMGRR